MDRVCQLFPRQTESVYSADTTLIYGRQIVKFAICNELFEGWELGKFCALSSSLGYSGIEFAPFTLGENPLTVPRSVRLKIRDTVKEHGLECTGLHWLLAKTDGLHLTTNDAATRTRTVNYLAGLAELCRDLGGSTMVLGSPRQRSLLPGVTETQALENAADVLQRLVPALEEQNVTIALEPLGPEETDFLNTADQAVELIEQIQSPYVRLLLDVKAMSTEQKPIPEIIGQHHLHLAHFHANDPNRLGPGMGEVDFRPILQALNKCNYDGWVSVEVFDFTPGPETIASKSIGNLKLALM